MTTPLHQRLYLRIWLAVVAAVAVLALVASALWQIESDRERAERERERAERPGREIIIRNQAGEILGQAPLRVSRLPGQGAEFLVPMRDGTQLYIQLPRPVRPPEGRPSEGRSTDARPSEGRPPESRFPEGRPPEGFSPDGRSSSSRMNPPGMMRLPFNFAWMLALVALAVAVGTYPIVRRLTKRLEAVQQGVERWGDGDLSTRLPETGQDEVAFLAQRFNHSAQQIQTLLTDQKTLLESQKALLASQKSLLANASHELRSPLARIRMGLELMQSVSPQGAADATATAFKTEIARNITELDQLIEEILLASRLDAQEADMGTVETLDLIGLAAEECARVGAELDVQGPSRPDVASAAFTPPNPSNLSGGLAATAAPDPQLKVKGVAKLLRRALRNLLENARRHGAGEVSVSLQNVSGQALIKVCDRGPGVPQAYQERIFEAFYRLPGASEQGGGVGLGLALVKSIATRHGGSVSCNNRDGGGACFSIQLPLEAAPKATSA